MANKKLIYGVITIDMLTRLAEKSASKSDILVYLALICYGGKNRKAFPAVSSLVEKTKLTERSVRRSLSFLRKKGFVMAIPKVGSVTTYRILTEASPATPEAVEVSPATPEAVEASPAMPGPIEDDRPFIYIPQPPSGPRPLEIDNRDPFLIKLEKWKREAEEESK